MAADISPSSGPSGLFPFSCYHQHRTSFSCTLSPPLCTLGAWWGGELISHLPAALTFSPSCTAWWQETDTGCGLLHHLFLFAHSIQSKSGSAEGLGTRLGIACNYVHTGMWQAYATRKKSWHQIPQLSMIRQETVELPKTLVSKWIHLWF